MQNYNKLLQNWILRGTLLLINAGQAIAIVKNSRRSPDNELANRRAVVWRVRVERWVRLLFNFEHLIQFYKHRSNKAL